MERLKDTHFEPASLEAEASTLLRGAEPYSAPPSLKRNVRVRLVEAAPRRRMCVAVRVAVAAGVRCFVAISVQRSVKFGKSLTRRARRRPRRACPRPARRSRMIRAKAERVLSAD